MNTKGKTVIKASKIFKNLFFNLFGSAVLLVVIMLAAQGSHVKVGNASSTDFSFHTPPMSNYTSTDYAFHTPPMSDYKVVDNSFHTPPMSDYKP